MNNRANGNGNAGPLKTSERDTMKEQVAHYIRQALLAMRMDVENDLNMQDTPERVARMWVDEVFAGRFDPAPAVTSFPNVGKLDEVYIVGPIAVRSTCAHHLCPIEGRVWCGMIPGERLIGLSKFTRLCRWVMARPQMQEEATAQLADLLQSTAQPLGVAVVMRARHTCMTWRGVSEHESEMVTSVMRGLFRTEAPARAEFLRLIDGTRFSAS